MHLDIAHHLIDTVAAGQHAGHGNQRAGVLRNAVLELVSDQPERLHKEGDERVEEAGRALGCRQCEHQQEGGHHIPGHARLRQEPADGEHGERGDQKHRRRNRKPVELAHRPDDTLRHQRPVTQRLLKFETTLAHEHGADIDGMCLVRLHRRIGARHFDSGTRNLNFSLGRTARQKFDSIAVGVSRTEIERFVIGLFAQNLVDVADFLEPHRPFGIVDFAQALDDVAHRHVAGCKTVMFRHHDVFGVRAGSMQALFEPCHRKTRCLGAVAETIKELRCERWVVDQRIDLLQKGRGGFRIVETNDLVNDLVRLLAHAARTLHTDGDAAKIFDEDKTNDRRQRPQFTDLQRL
ncbi:hypothetical protein D3C71_771510 [compost metagenome]